MESTFREMTVEHLGPDADADDLALFREACEKLVATGDYTDAEATERVWREGDWYGMAHLVLDEIAC
jgi:hypothetical protein